MIIKRLFDLFFSLLGIIVLSPVFFVIALWIKIDSKGPVFFRQVRVGQFGREFKIYKFRTMVNDAEALGKQITIGDDYRITSCGKFLRKYKLDELPQLFNVFKGEMSFVGSRPEVPKYVALYNQEQFKVLNFPPGITDLASIEFRNESDLLSIAEDPEEFYIKKIMTKKLELNGKYIDLFTRFNILFDIFIVFKTIRCILFK